MKELIEQYDHPLIGGFLEPPSAKTLTMEEKIDRLFDIVMHLQIQINELARLQASPVARTHFKRIVSKYDLDKHNQKLPK